MLLALSFDTVLTFTKQLYALLNAGVPLFRSLQILRQQAREYQLQQMLDTVLHDLAEGQAFSESLRKYTESFTNFYINMIIVGESRGELPAALKRIVAFFEKSKEFKEKLFGALMYPLILLITGFIVSLVMLLVVLPKFVTVFETANIVLPLPTRILLAIQHFIVAYSVFLLVLGVASIVLAIVAWYRPWGRRIYDRLALRLPLLGRLFLIIFVVRFCRTLGTLYNSGVQLMPALELSVNSVGNSKMQAEFAQTLYSVRDGKGLAVPLAKSKLIPPMVSNMIAVGEETGDLERVLLDIADYYEQEVQYVLKNVMSVLEPLALVVLSLFVMFIASAVMLPLFRMSATIHTF